MTEPFVKKEYINVQVTPARWTDAYGQERFRYTILVDSELFGQYTGATFTLSDEFAIAMRDTLLERFPLPQEAKQKEG